MGKRIYFLDNLRASLLFLIVLANVAAIFMVYTPAGYVADTRRWLGADALFFWKDAFIMPVLFFICGYFGASTLRIRLLKPFFIRKWQRIGWPWVIGSVMLAPELAYIALSSREQAPDFITFYTTRFWTDLYQQGPFWFLGLLLLCYLLFMGAKHCWPHLLQKRTLRQPSPLFVCVFIVINALSFYLTSQIYADTSWVCPLYLLQFQPTRLPSCLLYFLLGIGAFKQCWFTRGGYFPSVWWLLPFIICSVSWTVFRLQPELSNAYPAAAALLYALTGMTALFGGLGGFHHWGDTEGPLSHRFVPLAYPVFFLHQPLLQNTAYFIRPLEIGGLLKCMVICLLSGIYAYILCKYVLLRLSSFKK